MSQCFPNNSKFLNFSDTTCSNKIVTNLTTNAGTTLLYHDGLSGFGKSCNNI